jgi:hypothetical protein
MFSARVFRQTSTVLLGLLLIYPGAALAQRHGGGRAGGLPPGMSRPDGVSEKDALKDFHQAMAVQATSQQISEFQLLLKNMDAAKAALQAYLKKGNTPPAAGSGPGDTVVSPAVQNVREESKKFLQGFSDKQKSGLKDPIKRVEKADQTLEDEQKKFNQIRQTSGKEAELAARANGFDQALTAFSNQQLALGREMGITLASGQDLTFNLPAVKSTASIASRPVELTISGDLSEVSAQGGQRTFRLELIADLSDLQQKVTELMRAQLDRSNPCGENLAVRQADLLPSTGASSLLLKLHYERWTCIRMSGPTASTELAESDGAAEIKLVPTVEASNTVKVAATFGRIDATGLMADALGSSALGDELREKVAQSFLSSIRAAEDFNSVLPPAIRGSVVLQGAKFEDSGLGKLALRLEGQVEITDEQANVLARQLNQTLSAQGSAPQ